MNTNMTKYKIENKLICLLNKCDEFEYDKITEEYLPVDEELKEMYTQTKNIINTCRKYIYNDPNISIQCISCEDSYIYKMYKRNSKEKLDHKYMNKFGSNEYRKTQWNKLFDAKKTNQIIKLFKDLDYSDRIEQCGFKVFCKLLEHTLSAQKQYDLLLNHIKLKKNLKIIDK